MTNTWQAQAEKTTNWKNPARTVAPWKSLAKPPTKWSAQPVGKSTWRALAKSVTTWKTAAPNGNATLAQTATAGGTISALKCVKVFNGTASVVSSNTVVDAGSVVGVATVAGTIGSTITIQTAGPLTDPSFNFVEGQIWCGADGSLTQTPPASGFTQVIGTSEGTHTIQIDVQQPYLI